MGRYLLVGGAGFIGQKLASSLIQDGHLVHIFDNFSSQIHGSGQGVNALKEALTVSCGLTTGDIRNPQDFNKIDFDFDAVVHLASETGTGQSMYQQHKYFDVNINGTVNLLEYIRSRQDLKVTKIINASSRAIYGEGAYETKIGRLIYPKQRQKKHLESGIFEMLDRETNEILTPVATPESAPCRPLSIYAISKQAQENLILNFSGVYQLDVVSLRFQNVYGPGQSLKNPYTGLLSVFANRILNNNPLNVFEDGKCSRDFIYIDDVVSAIKRSLEVGFTEDQIINIGSGISTNIIDVANTIRECFDSDIEIEISGDYRMGDIRSNFADIKAAERLLDWRPITEIGFGIGKFAEWAMEQSKPKDLFTKSQDELRRQGLLLESKKQ